MKTIEEQVEGFKATHYPSGTTGNLLIDKALRKYYEESEVLYRNGLQDSARIAKAEWLREEIEKLNVSVEDTKKYWNERAPHNCSLCWEDEYCSHELERETLQTIIDRYQK